MLTHRIIPCLDVHAGRVVKGVNFLNLRDAGDPVQIARLYDQAGADELVFLDITASHEDREITYDMVRQVAEQCFMPFTVGGGIRVIDDVTRLVQAGAEKVSINTAAVHSPTIVSETAHRFGRCATVVNIDPKRVPRADFEKRLKTDFDNKSPLADELADDLDLQGDVVFEVHTHGGRKPTGLEAVSYARKIVELGAGEIVLTSMDADGTRNGYDIEVTRAVGDAIDVPIIASGGCGSPQHMIDVLTQTRADACLVASILHYCEYTIAQTKQALHDAGLPVRMLQDQS